MDLDVMPGAVALGDVNKDGILDLGVSSKAGDKESVRILNSADARIYSNTFIDTPASFERNERSATGDHFGWHPATGPGVEEREGHMFVNNLIVWTRPCGRSSRARSSAATS